MKNFKNGLELAQYKVREKLNEVPNEHHVPIKTTDKALELAKTSINEAGVLKKRHWKETHLLDSVL